MLAAVVPLSAPLDQRPGETDREYAAFGLWVLGPRGTPHDPALAGRNGWAERAVAYDATRTQTAPDTLQDIGRRFQGVLSREVRKLERASNVTDVAVPVPKDLLALFLALRGAPEAPVDNELPVEDMTVEELRAVETVDAMHRRSSGRRAG